MRHNYGKHLNGIIKLASLLLANDPFVRLGLVVRVKVNTLWTTLFLKTRVKRDVSVRKQKLTSIKLTVEPIKLLRLWLSTST